MKRVATFDYKEYLKKQKYTPSIETVKATTPAGLAQSALANETQKAAAKNLPFIATPKKENNGYTVMPSKAVKPGTTIQSKKTTGETDGTGSTGGDPNAAYRAQLSSLYDQIMGYPSFQYDLTGDMLYRQMADQYTQLGQQAMRDTMGTAAGLTGGYGNSYAQQVGNQAYQQYLTALNEQVPNLYDRAYNTWAGEYDRLLQQYQLAAAHPEYMAALYPSSGGGVQSGSTGSLSGLISSAAGAVGDAASYIKQMLGVNQAPEYSYEDYQKKLLAALNNAMSGN